MIGIRMTGSGANGDEGEFIHAPGSGQAGYMTLCGYCDVPGSEEVEIRSASEITCTGCIDTIKTALPYAGAVRRRKH